MIRHLFSLAWHRKGANALVMLEIFFSFLVVFAVATLGSSMWSRWRTPLGFSWQNVWVIDVEETHEAKNASTSSSSTIDGTNNASGGARPNVSMGPKPVPHISALLAELRAMPPIERAASDVMTPYAGRTWSSVIKRDDRRYEVTRDVASDDFATVMDIPLLHGRWFNREDDADNALPVVIDADLARNMFGNVDPIGKKFDDFNEESHGKGVRVVGVIPPFRLQGELTQPGINMIFFRRAANPVATGDTETNVIVVRVRPDTPASFEAEMLHRMHEVSPTSTFRLRRMSQMRTAASEQRIIPAMALSLVALFLLLMVGLGLTGVLWQTVTRRMRELGLRRALGATGGSVRAQVLGEVVVLTTMAVAIGAIVTVQLPLLGISRIVTPGEFWSGFAAALAAIYMLTLLCGAYPSWLASTVQPADALRQE